METFVSFHRAMSRLSDEEFTEFLNQSLVKYGRTFFEAAIFEKTLSMINEDGVKIAQDMEQSIHIIHNKSLQSSLPSKLQSPPLISPMFTLSKLPSSVVNYIGSYLPFNDLLSFEKVSRDTFFSLRRPCSPLQEIDIHINFDVYYGISINFYLANISLHRFTKVKKVTLYFSLSPFDGMEIYAIPEILNVQRITKSVTDVHLCGSDSFQITNLSEKIEYMPIFRAIQSLQLSHFPIQLLFIEFEYYFNSQLKKLIYNAGNLGNESAVDIKTALLSCTSLVHLSLSVDAVGNPSQLSSKLSNAMKHLKTLKLKKGNALRFSSIYEQLIHCTSNQLLSLHTPSNSFYSSTNNNSTELYFQGCKNLKELRITELNADALSVECILKTAPVLKHISIAFGDMKDDIPAEMTAKLVGSVFGKSSLVSIQFESDVKSVHLLSKYIRDAKIKNRYELVFKHLINKRMDGDLKDYDICSVVNAIKKTIDQWLIIIELHDDNEEKDSNNLICNQFEECLQTLEENFQLIHVNVVGNALKISNAVDMRALKDACV